MKKLIVLVAVAAALSGCTMLKDTDGCCSKDKACCKMKKSCCTTDCSCKMDKTGCSAGTCPMPSN